MADFEIKYIKKTLGIIYDILGDKNKSLDAIVLYTQGKRGDTRFQHDNKITCCFIWPEAEILELMSAVYSAYSRANHYFESTQSKEEIEQAQNLLLDRIIPLITQNVRYSNRIESVRKNIRDYDPQKDAFLGLGLGGVVITYTPVESPEGQDSSSPPVNNPRSTPTIAATPSLTSDLQESEEASTQLGRNNYSFFSSVLETISRLNPCQSRRPS